jgi:hypothetical protein
MTTRKGADPGDQDPGQKQPSRARRAILTGSAVGLAAAAGSTLGRAQPASATTGLPGVAVISPTGDTSGAEDITAFNNALSSLDNVGTVWLAPGTYYINATGISIPPYVNVYSPGNNQTVIKCVGGGTGTYVMMANTADPTSYTRLSGCLQGFVIDGSSAGNGAIGLQFQDTNAVYIDVGVRNFTGTGSIGVQLANKNHSLNQLDGYARIENCTNALMLTTSGPSAAIEHLYVDWSINSNAGQNPITLANGMGIQGSRFTCAVGCDPGGGPVFTFGAGCTFSDTIFEFKAEQTAPSTSSTTVSFSGPGSGWIRCTGVLFFSPNLNPSNIATAGGGKVQFDGPISGDATLLNLPSGTTSNTTYTNQGCPCIVAISGGTVTAITINGVLLTGLTSGAFYIPPGGTYLFNYTGSTITFTSAAP